MSPTKTASEKKSTTVDEKPTLMLLDGNSLAFRAFYALPAENFKTQGGLTTNAVYGFTAMLINLLRDETPTHVAAAFDVSRQTFRSEQLPGVQGGPLRDTRRVPRSDRHHQGSARRAGHHGARRAGVRGGRHHRHAGHPGRGRGPAGAGGHRRPRRAATGQPRRDGPVPDQGGQRAHPVHAGGRVEQVRPDAQRSTRISRRCAAIPATTCRESRASARRPPPSGSPNTGRCSRWSTTWIRSRARSATRCAPTSPAWC